MDSFLIWLIIMIIVAIAKGVEKIKESRPTKTDRPAPRKRESQRPPTVRRSSTPPVMPKPVGGEPLPSPRQTEPDTATWRVDETVLRRFMDEIAPPVPPPVPPLVRQPVVEEPKPVMSQRVAAQPAEPVKPVRSRASEWAEAMRDRNNLRNTIMAMEILGPCKAEQN